MIPYGLSHFSETCQRFTASPLQRHAIFGPFEAFGAEP